MEKSRTWFSGKNTCKWISEFLEKEGFDVEVGKFGVPTSIRATRGNSNLQRSFGRI